MSWAISRNSAANWEPVNKQQDAPDVGMGDLQLVQRDIAACAAIFEEQLWVAVACNLPLREEKVHQIQHAMCCNPQASIANPSHS
jgi:hypothetical protein